MKNFTLLFFLISISALSQQQIKKDIETYHQNGYTFPSYDILQDTDRSTERLKSDVKNASIFEVNKGTLKEIYQTQPLLIKFSFPFKGEMVNIELYRKNPLEDSFSAFTQDEEKLPIKSGVHYRGVIANSSRSVASFSFYNNSLYGVASSIELGNINIGKIKDNDDYIIYAEQDLMETNPFECRYEEMTENMQQTIEQGVSSTKSNLTTTNCVRIYYEVAYEPYLQNNSDVSQTVNWVTAIHNNISTLYANDGINIALSEVMVWTEPDPYVYDFSNNLMLFSNTRNYFNGDLAHLINQPTTTSVAYLNTLCENNNYAYSAVEQYYNQVPTYSWTIGASTHEMGHSFSSPHTHQCLWNGDNTPIDGCGTLAGVNERFTNCSTGPIPQNGGTIMSYCHLNSVGVNLSLGFGPQPSQLIRNTIDSKNCLGTDCINSCFMSIQDITFLSDGSNSIEMEIVDNYSTEWYYLFYEFGLQGGSWNYSFSPFIDFQNLTPNTYYEVTVANSCTNINDIGGYYSSLFLSDWDYCQGGNFTDTGGPNRDYGDEQTLIKTFYPDSTGEVIELEFLAFHLEEDYDFMSVYDGTSIDAPLFSGGNNLTGDLSGSLPTFKATNPDGAITVKFTSDMYSHEAGWDAEISCVSANLTANNFDKKDIKIYPNPAQSNFTISSDQEINNVTIYDIAGRKVIERKSINDLNTTINIETLSNGAYFVNINSQNTTQTFKVIKN